MTRLAAPADAEGARPPAAGVGRATRGADSTAPRHLAADEERLMACVHCGFCLPACPTYGALGDENDSPRGRLHLMRALIEGRLEVDGAFGTHIGRCLGCRACEPVCPAGVEFGALLESARADQAERARGPLRRLGRLAGRVGLWLLTGPPRRPAYALLRLARAACVTRPASRLPGRAGLAAALLEATRPTRAGTPVEDGEPAAGRRRGGPASGRPARGAPTYALLEGCVMAGLFPHVQAATRRVLAAAGYREVRAAGQGCCGALHAHAGFLDAARRLARRNVAAFEAAGADRLVTDSAGCGAALREYPRWLSGEPGWRARAGRLADRARDVSLLLADPPRPLEGRLEGRIGYDAPCHLLHGQGVREAPLALLGALRGADVEPLASWERCCGGAGVYNLLHAGLSRRVLAGKLEEARRGGYDWVATGNPGCIMQVGAGLRSAGIGARAVHPVELVDAALRNMRAAPGSDAGSARRTAPAAAAPPDPGRGGR